MNDWERLQIAVEALKNIEKCLGYNPKGFFRRWFLGQIISHLRLHARHTLNEIQKGS